MHQTRWCRVGEGKGVQKKYGSSAYEREREKNVGGVGDREGDESKNPTLKPGKNEPEQRELWGEEGENPGRGYVKNERRRVMKGPNGKARNKAGR